MAEHDDPGGDSGPGPDTGCRQCGAFVHRLGRGSEGLSRPCSRSGGGVLLCLLLLVDADHQRGATEKEEARQSSKSTGNLECE